MTWFDISDYVGDSGLYEDGKVEETKVLQSPYRYFNIPSVASEITRVLQKDALGFMIALYHLMIAMTRTKVVGIIQSVDTQDHYFIEFQLEKMKLYLRDYQPLIEYLLQSEIECWVDPDNKLIQLRTPIQNVVLEATFGLNPPPADLL